MTFDSDPEAAADETVVDGETTEPSISPHEAWPVAEQYRIDTDQRPAATSAVQHDPSETIVVAQSEAPVGGRHFPPRAGAGALAAILAVTATLIALAGFFQLRGEQASSAPPATTAGPSTRPMPEKAATPASQEGVALADVGGLSLVQARKRLGAAGLRVRVTRAESDRPVGEVLSQTPAAKAIVARSDAVLLVVSRGPQPRPTSAAVPVPGVVGLSASDAVAIIRHAGLVPRIRFVESPEPAGTVVLQSPAGSESVTQGALVRINVARSRTPATRDTVDVPELVGDTVADARRRLGSAGLAAIVVKVESEAPEGTVVRQSRAAGAKVRKGSSIRLEVSLGVQAVPVADVTGLDEASARSQLENAGFHVRAVYVTTSDPAADGVVLEQDPSGGTAAKGVVTLTVGRLG